ncbi:MAG: twin-arginine translocase subunit TatC [FCB group bacterium]|nr:twin-arginine translocase subunit TatC [FCB group bacterium]
MNEKLDSGGMTFWEHLEELRSRLIKAIISLGIAFVTAYIFASYILDFLTAPFIVSGGTHLALLAPTEGFMVKLKTAFLGAIVLAAPMVFYQIFRFVAPGLHEHERRMTLPVVLWLTVSFFIGGMFAYHVLPYAMKFFQSFAGEGVENFWSLGKYISFVTYMLLGFGLVFELPLVIYFAARLGLVTPQFLRRNRRYAIIILLAASALVTPPDVITQIILAIPLIILYEISIFLAAAAIKKSKNK